MRKVKLKLQCQLPSWNFCNYDGPTADNRISKECCKFCSKHKKGGHHCLLFDKSLKSDERFVYKTEDCITATAGFGVEIVPTTQVPAVDPKAIAKEVIKQYTKVLNDLLAQGYPQYMADSLAKKYVTGEK